MSGIGQAKIILIGEHSVVYGHPALALPFRHLKSTVTLEKSDTFIIDSKYFKGPLEEAISPMHGIKFLIETLIADYNKEIHPVTIKITSNIPEKSGLGSSASIAKAVINAFDNYFSLSLTKETYFKYLELSENVYHDRASGIDAATVINERPLRFEKGTINELPFNINGYLMVISSNAPSSTKDAVIRVRKHEQRDLHINNLAKYTKEAEIALQNNNITSLGTLFNYAHESLRSLDLSTPLLEKLRNSLLNNNALGVKLTGGGMGGCLIALFKTKEDAHAAAKQIKDYETWILEMGEIL